MGVETAENTNSEHIYNKKTKNRKRKYQDMQNENVQRNVDEKEKYEKPKKKKQKLQNIKNVMITPSIVGKTRPNQKIMTTSSRRTLVRSSKGGALGSGTKRPIRVVIEHKNNNNKNMQQIKKRKLNKNIQQNIDKTPSNTKKPSIQYSMTVFSKQSNHRKITDSAIKEKSSQWADRERIQKRRRKRRKSMKKPNNTLPPM